MRRCLLSLVSCALVACNQPRGDPPPPASADADGGDGTASIAFTGFNNGVTLSGTSFPGGTDNVDDLHRSATTVERPDHPAFAVGTAVVARTNVTATTAAYVIVPVENIDSRPYCFVRVTSVRYRQLNDTVLGESAMREVRGSVGQDAGAFTASCLAPGEIGYFCDQVVGDVYESIATIELELGTSLDLSLADPEAHLVPAAYHYDAASGLTLVVENRGRRAAHLVDGASIYLLIDGDDSPLWFNALTSTGALVVAAAGSTTLSDATVPYNGNADRMLVFFDFADE